jgi:quinoprotein glucose dehydrogenase
VNGDGKPDLVTMGIIAGEAIHIYPGDGRGNFAAAIKLPGAITIKQRAYDFLLADLNGDGKADVSSIYSDGFNSALDGIASGVLAHREKLWFANIPQITELRGIDNNGRAKSRKSISYGYGVRFSYTGHDLHGLILGPDGKLYFSFGDRGASVTTKEGKTLAYPDEGAVFRCNPDGTDMEVVHRGLRNPQELAFDQFGNLFTGDNNSDGGDRARIVHLVEGGDSGWRIGWQFLERPNARGAWNSERVRWEIDRSSPTHRTPTSSA